MQQSQTTLQTLFWEGSSSITTLLPNVHPMQNHIQPKKIVYLINHGDCVWQYLIEACKCQLILQVLGIISLLN